MSEAVLTLNFLVRKRALPLLFLLSSFLPILKVQANVSCSDIITSIRTSRPTLTLSNETQDFQKIFPIRKSNAKPFNYEQNIQIISNTIEKILNSHYLENKGSLTIKLDAETYGNVTITGLNQQSSKLLLEALKNNNEFSESVNTIFSSGNRLIEINVAIDSTNKAQRNKIHVKSWFTYEVEDFKPIFKVNTSHLREFQNLNRVIDSKKEDIKKLKVEFERLSEEMGRYINRLSELDPNSREYQSLQIELFKIPIRATQVGKSYSIKLARVYEGLARVYATLAREHPDRRAEFNSEYRRLKDLAANERSYASYYQDENATATNWARSLGVEKPISSEKQKAISKSIAKFVKFSSKDLDPQILSSTFVANQIQSLPGQIRSKFLSYHTNLKKLLSGKKNNIHIGPLFDMDVTKADFIRRPIGPLKNEAYRNIARQAQEYLYDTFGPTGFASWLADLSVEVALKQRELGELRWSSKTLDFRPLGTIMIYQAESPPSTPVTVNNVPLLSQAAFHQVLDRRAAQFGFHINANKLFSEKDLNPGSQYIGKLRPIEDFTESSHSFTELIKSSVLFTDDVFKEYPHGRYPHVLQALYLAERFRIDYGTDFLPQYFELIVNAPESYWLTLFDLPGQRNASSPNYVTQVSKLALPVD